ncbi:MAG: sugar transferase [Chloroflexi bacterium]|nr:sugar transferase [Chloroflexota bacterium]
MRRNEYLYLIALWLIGDALAIFVALNAAFFVRYNFDWLLPFIERLDPIAERYAVIIPFAVPLWLALFAFNRLYDRRYLLAGLQEYGKVAASSAMGVLALVVLSYSVPNLSISRSWLVLSWLFVTFLVSATRFTIRRLVRVARARGQFVARALIVGANEHAIAIAQQLTPATASGIQVVGFLDDFLPREMRVLGDLRVLDRASALARVARETGATQAIVVQGAIAWESFAEIITQSISTLDGLEIKLSPGFYEIMATGVRLTQDGFVPLLALEKNRITGLDAALKYLLDYSLGLFFAMLASPFILLIAALVKIVSPGRVFDPYPVLGLREKQFVTWKFRTRHLQSDQDHAFGHLIYRLGLDKLPQFFNVLRGEMSMVGPRPVPRTSVLKYQEWLPTLASVKPGITGPWVVAGDTIDSFEAEIRLDLYYIRNWTIWLDAQILLQTVLRLFQGVRPKTKR